MPPPAAGEPNVDVPLPNNEPPELPNPVEGAVGVVPIPVGVPKSDGAGGFAAAAAAPKTDEGVVEFVCAVVVPPKEKADMAGVIDGAAVEAGAGAAATCPNTD